MRVADFTIVFRITAPHAAAPNVAMFAPFEATQYPGGVDEARALVLADDALLAEVFGDSVEVDCVLPGIVDAIPSCDWRF